MHFGPDAVAAVLLEDPVPASGLDDPLHGVANIGQSAPKVGGGNPGPERGLAGLNQLLVGRIDVTNADGEGSVSMPAIEDCSTVDRDDISVFDDPVPWDPVDDLIVD
ncbi:hypothetical protein GALL_397600 [mine drainage metagenome]|uniref:Uncharacterized protein n=1 Tax=mine drainage metagenome TaxID=410659 RepID=A0A1J5Q487_9ZZZZ